MKARKSNSLSGKVRNLSLVALGAFSALILLGSCKKDTPASLSGVVSDSETGQSVSGAKVNLVENDMNFTTGDDGHYEFVQIGAGTYNIKVTHPDYGDYEKSVAVGEDDATADVQLVMKTYSLSGTVKDSKSGQALAGVAVKPAGGSNKTTDANGAYTLENLKRGELKITFSKEGYKDKDGTANIPGATTLNIELEAYASTLTGKVTDSRNKQPVADVVVSNGEGATSKTGANGVYTFTGLNKTSYTITATKTGFTTYTNTVNVSIAQESNTYSFQMTPTTTSLSGKVTDGATNAGLSGVTVSLNNGGGSTTTGSDGTYRFENLSQTSYTLTASKSGYDNFSGSVSVNLGIENNTYNFSMNVTYVQPTTALTGKVTDSSSGAALSGVTVTLGSQTYVTASAGTYRFDNLTGTSYTLTATRTDYVNFNTTVTLNLSVATNTRDIAMNRAPQPSPATVTATSALSISDGIYFDLSFNSSASTYLRKLYPTSEISSLSDAAIITKLESESSVISTANVIGIFSPSLNANTAYTWCAVARDAQGRNGVLYKRAMSTKGTSSQPRATINVSSVSSQSISFSVTQNTYCYSYDLWLGAATGTLQDIEYAYYAYSEGTRYTGDGNGSIPRDASWAYTFIIALGYTSSGVNSGYVDVKIIRNSDGVVVRSESVDIRSLGKENIEKMKNNGIDAKLIKGIFEVKK
ncbi:MAG: carboxypeptidase regulatory-like domain-containing protein [Tannerella sp.]|jgi:hypothetical protein|nr:carboxypeptidase regulatory-like domain-containing protein [Tannerella sp.]